MFYQYTKSFITMPKQNAHGLGGHNTDNLQLAVEAIGVWYSIQISLDTASEKSWKQSSPGPLVALHIQQKTFDV
jgi:hypothetical protein